MDPETAPVPPAVRQGRALGILRERGFITCREIQAAFQVSEATARRDVDALVRRGVASRIHGGAMLPNREFDSARAALAG